MDGLTKGGQAHTGQLSLAFHVSLAPATPTVTSCPGVIVLDRATIIPSDYTYDPRLRCGKGSRQLMGPLSSTATATELLANGSQWLQPKHSKEYAEQQAVVVLPATVLKLQTVAMSYKSLKLMTCFLKGDFHFVNGIRMHRLNFSATQINL